MLSSSADHTSVGGAIDNILSKAISGDAGHRKEMNGGIKLTPIIARAKIPPKAVLWIVNPSWEDNFLSRFSCYAQFFCVRVMMGSP